MANYKILFTSLRNGRQYTLNIGGSTGTAIQLYGAVQSFTTDEDNSEDIFKPMRTQSGYVRIVDNGLSADVSPVSVDWSDIIPADDLDRPITLTHVEGNTTVYDWVGFIQTQTFDGPLYDPAPEREFPVQCILQALDSVPVDYLASGESSIVSFFGLIAKAFSHIPAAMVGNFIIQGGNDAYTWLNAKFDWQNLFNKNDLTPKYSYKQALEDMCRFWGFTMRTSGRDIYLTQSGAKDVVNKLTMTLSNIQTVAAGGTAGSVTTGYYTNKQSGTDFASTEQDIIYLRGSNNVIVKTDCNPQDIGVEFAPKDVEKNLEQNTIWSWISVEGSQVGYFFTNPPKTSFNGNTLVGIGSASGQFGRVQIFSNEEAEDPIQADVIYITDFAEQGVVKASIETVHDHCFGAGSFEMTADIFKGVERQNYDVDSKEFMIMRIGIGPSRNSFQTKWFNITDKGHPGWGTSPQTFGVFPKNNRLCPGIYWFYYFNRIPLDDGLTGKLFIDFYGSYNNSDSMGKSFMIANFKLKYSRDIYIYRDSTSSEFPDRVVSVERQSSCEYNGAEWGKNDSTWSADCIYASDNNMEYGLGLLMDGNNWLTTASYNGTQKRPEEHLAAAVLDFWKSKRTMMTLELQYNSVGDVRPDNTVDGAYPVSISHDWRDDIIKISKIA